MGKHLAVAVLHRICARHQACLFREGGEQPLRECVDRIDSQSAARSVEHLCEQGSRMGLGVSIEGRADCLQVDSQIGGFHPDPAGQHGVDPSCHFRSARLGEGEAKDLAGIDARTQQQAKHAGGKDLRLAGARRGGKPHAVARVDGERLIVLQCMDCAAAHSSRPIHSSSRIS